MATKRNLECMQKSFCMKKRRTTSPDWSAMHSDLLETILKHMPFVDKLRFKDTCSSWNSATKTHVKSLLIESKNEPPMLLVPTDPEDNKMENRLFDIVNKVQKPLNMPVRSHCIGSSQGWLILLQDQANLLIYNPLLDVKLQLPSIVSFPDFDYNPMNLSEHWISKGILWGDPFLGHNYGVAVIYDSNGFHSKLAFAKHGDSRWTQFEDSRGDYCDITYCKDFIYALLSGSLSVEVWNCNGLYYPEKVINFKLSFPGNISELKGASMELYTSQTYLVKSKSGDVLLVVRCIGEFVNPYGELVREEDLLEEDNKEYCCPYMTKNFYVYKLDENNREWIELQNLGDEMLFVGGNQSVSLLAKDYAGCKENTIYFTDDYWLRMNEDYMYGGHDMGIFDLGDKSIKEIYECNLEYRMTPAFWILPPLIHG